MTAIVAVSSRDHAPAAEAMAATAILPARDQRTEIVAGDGYALGVTVGASRELGLSLHEDECVAVAFDGWIDDIDSRALAGDGPDRSWAAAVAHRYREAGADALSAIVGDFAFALWDKRQRQLLCARDYVGVRPLFYAVAGPHFACASQLKQLTSCAFVSGGLDPQYFAEAIVNAAQHGGRSPLRAVRRVLPGRLLTVTGGRVVTRMLWTPGTTIAVSRESDAVDGFRTVFQHAIGKYVIHRGAVASELSGGLDSSAIVCSAQHLMGGSRRDRGLCGAITVDFGYAPNSDETAIAQATARRWGVDHAIIRRGVDSFFVGWRKSVRYWDEPNPSMFAAPILQDYRSVLDTAGATALLNGMGAEAALASVIDVPIHLADWFRTGRWRGTVAELLAWQRVTKRPLLNLAWDAVIAPSLRRRGAPPIGNSAPPAWVQPAIIRACQETAAGPDAWAGDGLADAAHYDLIRKVSASLSRGLVERAVHVRYPFLYRPLVEFMLALPWQWKLRPLGSKWLLRAALKDLLPPAVRHRAMSTSGGHSRYLSLARHWSEVATLADGSQLAELGLIDPRRFRHALELARSGHAPDLPALLMSLAVEAWLHEHRGIRSRAAEGAYVACTS